MWNAVPTMYEHGINVAIRKLFVLFNVSNIERELDERFANAYPEFDPAVHTTLDPEQFELEKKDKYVPWLRQFKPAMKEQVALDRRRDWTEGLTRRIIWDGDVNYNYNPDNGVLRMQDFNARAAHEHQNIASHDRDDNGRQSLMSTGQGTRGSNDGSRVGGNPDKHRRNTLVAAPQGDEENW